MGSQSGDWSMALRGLTAGSLASIVSKTTVAPMDRVKLILQLQSQPSTSAAAPSYNGMVHCFQRLCAEQGFRSLWRGNVASISRCFPSHALNFVLRDYYRLLFLRNVDRRRQYGRFVLGNVAAGGVGAATSLCLLYPIDLVRTKLAVEMQKNGAKRYRGMVDCLKDVVRREGIAGAYRGFLVSLQFVVLSRAVFFGMFDTIRGTVVDDPKQLSFIQTWLMAQICVISSGFLCYPMDTVRRQLMLQSGRKTKEFSGSIDCWRKLTKSGGFPSLYRGALSNSLKSTSGALMVAIYYEAIKYM